MRTLLTLMALFIAAAALQAQPPPVKISGPPVAIGPPVAGGTIDSSIPATPPSDPMVAPVVAVICGIAILFAVCYPMRRDE